MKVKGSITSGKTVPHARLQKMEIAQKYGYTRQHFQEIVRKIESFEKHLFQLFGPSFKDIQFAGIRFLEGDMRITTAGIGLEGVRDLVIDAKRVSPETLLRRLIPYIAHEYGHVLTLNRKVLWKSLPESEKKRVGEFFKIHNREGLYTFEDKQLMLVFMGSLGEGLDNPYIRGLKTDRFDIGQIWNAIFLEAHDDDMSHMMTDRVIKFGVELITDRIADLIMVKTPAIEETVRDIAHSILASSKEMIDKKEEWWYFPESMHARVYAEKTGNADLLHYLEGRDFGPLYEELCQTFSTLWDQIGLKKMINIRRF